MVELEVGYYPYKFTNEVSLWDKNLTATLDNIAMQNGLFDIPMKVGKDMYEQALTIQVRVLSHPKPKLPPSQQDQPVFKKPYPRKI